MREGKIRLDRSAYVKLTRTHCWNMLLSSLILTSEDALSCSFVFRKGKEKLLNQQHPFRKDSALGVNEAINEGSSMLSESINKKHEL
jgi:hypothetical protein